MQQIDKVKFGKFIAELRRDRKLTQKELAQSLFISDKAVSKWETGASLPDTALLVPLSELLGVSVTELLLCRRLEEEDHISHETTEDVVKAAMNYKDVQERAWVKSGRWVLIYPFALITGGLGLWFGYRSGASALTVYTVAILASIFGAYFCFFVKTRLPAYYDDNRISGVYDSPFLMNVPGLYFNNSNWPYIILVGRIWSCTAAAAYPVINWLFSVYAAGFWAKVELYVCLFLVLGGLFVPMYIVGKKYEQNNAQRLK